MTDRTPAEDSPAGPELARQALEAARAKNAARRAAARQPGIGRPLPRSGGSAALRRRRWSGPGDDPARDPAPLSKMLQDVLGKAVPKSQLAAAQVLGRWEQLVGADVAAHADPVSLVDGVLLVQAETTAWATQLRGLAPQLIARLNRELGAGTVTRIRAQGPTGPSWRFGPWHVPGRGPRDTYG